MSPASTKKHVFVVGMGTDMTPDDVTKLKGHLAHDLIDREVHVIHGAWFIQEIVADLDRGRKQPILIVGMGIKIGTTEADTIRAEVKKWLPEHEVRFIVGGLCAADITIDVSAVDKSHGQNGYI